MIQQEQGMFTYQMIAYQIAKMIFGIDRNLQKYFKAIFHVQDQLLLINSLSCLYLFRLVQLRQLANETLFFVFKKLKKRQSNIFAKN
ncbi:unnamed protein product [Paramecium pentaurelia]|uniref:Uncharacterized protein n=1 Tax=Paramecium pentaurelia TaxID=43138 RepID=A0A8S1WNC8_9CILI|nr:unnamed protein product [Paramecium pentaurelia]